MCGECRLACYLVASVAARDASGEKDAAVYKRANIDRKLFSKIRSHKDYQPSKPTALAFAIALRLSLDETREFIGRAGLAWAPGSKQGIIVAYCVERGIYDIEEGSIALFDFKQSSLTK